MGISSVSGPDPVRVTEDEVFVGPSLLGVVSHVACWRKHMILYRAG
jgi:hypothetical protein